LAIKINNMYFRLLKEGFIFAVNSIIVNKLRTFLSLFGITIGIFSIISVFTVLDWMEKAVRDSVATLGNDIVYVQKWPWSFSSDLAWWDIAKWPAVSMDDYQAVLDKSTKTEAACFLVGQTETIKYKGSIANNAVIWAATHEIENLRSFEIENGRYFSPYESSSGRPVAILGAVIAERLFENVNPVGKEITIAGFKTIIIGVFKKEGQGGISDNMDEKALIPINFGKYFINLKNNNISSNILIKAKNNIAVQELTDETTMILRAARRLKPNLESNFSINRASLLTQGLDSIFAAINAGGWLIGGFAILVGGFGIANIMYVSVKERTNIIGIQKALGAKRYFILQQFLYESVLLSILGGILGLLMIFIGTSIINYLYEFNIHLTAANAFLAIFISGLIGVVAGYAPAYSAAKMNPVEAIGVSF
jgi:putative ABC transport system permease protein